jgi:hypothetical protein
VTPKQYETEGDSFLKTTVNGDESWVYYYQPGMVQRMTLFQPTNPKNSAYRHTHNKWTMPKEGMSLNKN